MTENEEKTKNTQNELRISVGDRAPGFVLRDVDGLKHKLTKFRGKRVMLSFYRYAA